MTTKEKLTYETLKRQVMFEQLQYLRDQLKSQDEIVDSLKKKLEVEQRQRLREHREQCIRNNEQKEQKRERMYTATTRRLGGI